MSGSLPGIQSSPGGKDLEAGQFEQSEPHATEREHLLAPADEVGLDPSSLPDDEHLAQPRAPAPPLPPFPMDLPRLVRDLEERCIAAALDMTAGNKRAAAELLGMGRTTLVEKLRRRAARALK
jgi:sigma-54 dependent transcriptional regulator, flagellar regulatory protein